MSESNVTRISRARREQREKRAAQSNYGQIRLTVTFERSGRATYRALAKRPQDGWQEQHVFAQGSESFGEYPPQFHDALMLFASVAEGLRWMPSERR